MLGADFVLYTTQYYVDRRQLMNLPPYTMVVLPASPEDSACPVQAFTPLPRTKSGQACSLLNAHHHSPVSQGQARSLLNPWARRACRRPTRWHDTPNSIVLVNRDAPGFPNPSLVAPRLHNWVLIYCHCNKQRAVTFSRLKRFLIYPGHHKSR